MGARPIAEELKGGPCGQSRDTALWSEQRHRTAGERRWKGFHTTESMSDLTLRAARSHLKSVERGTHEISIIS